MRVGKGITYSLGAAALGAVATLGYYLTRRDGEAARQAERATSEAEERVRERLLDDGLVSRGTLRVTALTPGIVELSGTLEDDDDAHRAMDLAQGVDGIHTVVNRIEVAAQGSRLSRNSRRYAAGEPELTESHWYGQRVGTGRRRQSPATDPDRPSDKVPTQTRELGTATAQDEVSEDVEKLAPSLADHTPNAAAPMHAGRVDEGRARGATDPRDNGGREYNSSSRVGDPGKPGVRRAIEEAGLRRRNAGEEREGER